MILAASSATSGWVILLLIAAAIAWYWLATGAHKTAIRMEVHKLPAKPLRIRWLPWHDGGEDNDTFYDVTLELPSGKRMSALCKCSNLSDVSWQSTPWSQELPQEHAPKPQFDPASQPLRVVADCSRCGYGLQQGWVACPNCGTELGACNSAEKQNKPAPAGAESRAKRCRSKVIQSITFQLVNPNTFK